MGVCGARRRYVGQLRQPGDAAWYEVNSGGQTHPVGTKLANGWGLRDMLGNVWEWVGDVYDPEYYAKSPLIDPNGSRAALKNEKLLRGGSWAGIAENVPFSGRAWGDPKIPQSTVGFRCGGQ